MKIRARVKQYDANGVVSGVRELVMDNSGGFYTEHGSLTIKNHDGENALSFAPRTWFNCVDAEAIPNENRTEPPQSEE